MTQKQKIDYIREQIRQEALREINDHSPSSIPMKAGYLQGYHAGYQNALNKAMGIIDAVNLLREKKR